MIDPSTCVNIVLGGVIGSVLLNGIFNPVRELTQCHYCNKCYSFYIRAVCTIVLLMLISNSVNMPKLFEIRKMIRKMGGETSMSNGTIIKAFLSAKMVLVILRTYAEFEMDPLIFLYTDHIPFLCVYALSYQFIKSLSIIRGINLELLKMIKSERGREDEFWAIGMNCKNLSSYMVAASEVREIYEKVKDVFGLQFFWVQTVILCGSAIHGFFIVHFTLKDEFSLSISIFLGVALIECFILSYFFAQVGESTANAAEDVIAEISRFPVAFCDRNGFQGVKHIILLNIRKPWRKDAWTFYGLTMDSFFSTVSGTMAFIFVCVQFNSGNSFYELSILE